MSEVVNRRQKMIPSRSNNDIQPRYNRFVESHLIDTRKTRIAERTDSNSCQRAEQLFRQPSHRTEQIYENVDMDMYLDRPETSHSGQSTRSCDFNIGIRRNGGIKKTNSWHFPCRKKNNKKKLTEVSGDLIPGRHPPHLESQILNKMKTIALSKATQGFWEESYAILLKIYDCERVTLMDGDHPEVANTLYHMGVALYNLGKYEKALSYLQIGLRILYARRYKDMNLDLGAIYFQLCTVLEKTGDLKAALHNIELSRQVEEHILGHATVRTTQKEIELKTAVRCSQKILRRSSY